MAFFLQELGKKFNVDCKVDDASKNPHNVLPQEFQALKNSILFDAPRKDGPFYKQEAPKKTSFGVPKSATGANREPLTTIHPKIEANKVENEQKPKLASIFEKQAKSRFESNVPHPLASNWHPEKDTFDSNRENTVPQIPQNFENYVPPPSMIVNQPMNPALAPQPCYNLPPMPNFQLNMGPRAPIHLVQHQHPPVQHPISQPHLQPYVSVPPAFIMAPRPDIAVNQVQVSHPCYKLIPRPEFYQNNSPRSNFQCQMGPQPQFPTPSSSFNFNADASQFVPKAKAGNFNHHLQATMSTEAVPNFSNGANIPQPGFNPNAPSFNPNAAPFVPDETPMPPEDKSLLNKILNEKLNSLNEGVVEISKQQLDPTSPLYSNQTFESLRLKKPLIDALYQMGFQQPSKIQEAALPMLLCEPPQDMIAQAQSGTGKTATFLLTMLNRLDPEKKYPQCICLAPTYELARQIGEVAKKMAKNMPEIQIRYAIKGETVSRGMSITDQMVIGTPGKMLDWVVKYRLIDPSKIICFVLDEADIMISQQGYQDQSIRLHNEIIAASPNCQCMLFSATFSDSVFNFANQMISDPVIITVRQKDLTLPNIKQYFVKCSDRSDKYRAISNLYCSLTIASSIIFCYTRSSATWLANQLRATGRDVALLHGEMPVMERAQAVEDFKNGKYKVMITTNVCARGLDIPQVALIVNYDPPVTFEENPQPDYDTYLHRIGRTGRFGKPGIAVNLVDSEVTMHFVKSFETYFGRPIEPLDDRDMDQLDKIEKETQ